MTSGPQPGETAIRSLATAQSYERGLEYYESGAVSGLGRRGNVLTAKVEGRSHEPHRVTIELDASGVVNANCTCPYDWGGICKHVVAVLLAYVNSQDEIEERSVIDALLADPDRDTLHGLPRDLLSESPNLIDRVEAQVAVRRPQASPQAPETSSTEPCQHPTPIDTDALRRQIRYEKRSFGVDDSYSVSSSGLLFVLNEILRQARQLIKAGDGHNGLAILRLLAGETVDDWYGYDHEGAAFEGFFERLGKALAEAILTADLSSAEREAWAAEIGAWQVELDNYSLERVFGAAIAAAELGWDYEPLQRAMQGHITEQGVWEGEKPPYADNLIAAYLNVLERQGRIDEYLRLAQTEGRTTRYVTMLVKAGRPEEAVDYAMRHLTQAAKAFTLAQALQEYDYSQAALQIGGYGLSLHGGKSALASWLRDFAAGLGDKVIALQAARAAFEAASELTEYQAVQELAGDEWPVIKQELLDALAVNPSVWGRIDIYLYEGMVDLAIQVVDSQRFVGYDALRKVVDAACKAHPDWAISQSKRQAEPIMGAGKSNAYHHALDWLDRARRAYLAAGRESEWRSYCQSLIGKHYRKNTLVPGLKQLLGDRSL
ncbi:MAG: hypothetical protein CVU38_09035 [Chloroflexi bacterium HGW-Chloroflexi-1]|nr:MAG: hypothetical protein CVU38_09035 [Chloroflexi bacterium HGW-Chloroflexi-1]